MKREEICGIYKITNNSNGKCYIGKAKDIYKRFWSHRNNSEKDKPDRRSSPALYHAFKKYGVENFNFEILEELKLNENLLKERELYWMDFYQSYEYCCGYNLRRDSETKMITHEKTSKKISERLKKEWKEGVRKNHSDKLKKKWEGNEERKKWQGDLLSKILTKYSYNLYTTEKEFIKNVLYKELIELGLKNCIAKFNKKKLNTITFKGYIIERVAEITD